MVYVRYIEMYTVIVSKRFEYANKNRPEGRLRLPRQNGLGFLLDFRSVSRVAVVAI
jgi:hypothetical protein